MNTRTYGEQRRVRIYVHDTIVPVRLRRSAVCSVWYGPPYRSGLMINVFFFVVGVVSKPVGVRTAAIRKYM